MTILGAEVVTTVVGSVLATGATGGTAWALIRLVITYQRNLTEAGLEELAKSRERTAVLEATNSELRLQRDQALDAATRYRRRLIAAGLNSDTERDPE